MSLGLDSNSYSFDTPYSVPRAYSLRGSSSNDDAPLSSSNDSRSPELQARPVTRALSKQAETPTLRYTPYLIRPDSLDLTERSSSHSLTSASGRPLFGSASVSGGSLWNPPPLKASEESNKMDADSEEKGDSMMPFIRLLRNMLADEEGYCDVLRWE